MGTETNWTVEVYDNETGEHYERPCTPDELAFYEELAKIQELVQPPDSGNE
jgi:hypothetical protein